MPTNAFTRVVVVLVGMVAAGALVRVREAPAQQAADFSIATYNINYGNTDLRGVVQSILKSNADLAALQETNKQSEDFLRKELTKTYPHVAFSPAGDAAGGFAMLSKAPLEKAQYYPRRAEDGGWFGRQTARVTLGGRELLIVNVHLTATTPQQGMDLKAVTALFLKTDAVREKEIRYIVGQLPKRWPVFVLGDFNSVPKVSGVPDFMVKSGFTDCMAGALPDADSVPTWHWKAAGTEYSSRLDYIFSARMSAKAAGGQVIPSDASDHYLVTCSFKPLPLPIALGPSHTEALNVAYIVDAADMTAERAATARGLVTASMTALTREQNVCFVTVGGTATAVPPEPAPATDETRALVAEALKKVPVRTESLLPAVRKATGLLQEEAAPKALFVLSDRLANDPALLKSARALVTDRRVQLFLLDAEGKPVGDAAGDAPPAPK